MSLRNRAASRFLPHLRERTIYATLALVVLSAIAFGQGPSLQFTMDSVNVRQEGVVSFSTLFLGPDSRSDFPAPRFLLGQTDDQTYRLYLDVDSIQQVRFNAFTFAVYLASAKETGRGAYKFQVTGNPTGSFRDAPVRVSFHVKNGTSNAVGGIIMPVYNATKSDLLVAEKQTEPAYVSVSGTTPLQIHLSNGADTLPVSVTDVSVGEAVQNAGHEWHRQ
jgi:hypothetical protein